MTDILFGQSYYLRFDPKLYAAMQPYPPLGTLFAASFMREQGYDVALFDAMLADSEQEWANALDKYQPRYAVIYEDNFNYLSKMCLLNMREAAFKMTKLAKKRSIPVIVCGSDATDHYEQYLQNGADVVIRGEGELTLQELMEHFTGKSNTSRAAIEGIAYLSDSGEVETTLPRPVMKQLDELPFPAWDLVDVEKYRGIWYERHGYYSVNMVTTRGCPYHCNWCAKPIWGQRYNVRSPQSVADELEWLKKNFQLDHIWFADDIMGLRPDWMQEFADEIEKRGIQTPFKCLSRADLILYKDTASALSRAGAKTVWMGAESGSQKILDAMEKGTKVEQIYESRKRLAEQGIEVGFFLQFGYLGETRDDIELTLKMVRESLPDDIGISVSYPLPGTKFYDMVKSQLNRTNWHDSEDLAMLYRGTFNTEFYRQLHTVVHKEFRARRTWQALWHGNINPLNPKHLRRLAAMAYHWTTLNSARRKLDSLARITPKDTIPLTAAN
ncbi:MAG: B12-binding domain-containing radical SAM protein [Chloroflexi bacterium]|nr:B12-binding domain-containing radical SAM protein [Chloroflexota bacterium]